MQPKVREYLTQLRQNAFLQIKPGFVDSGAAPGKDTTWQDPAQLKPETTTKEAVADQRHLRNSACGSLRPTGVKDAGGGGACSAAGSVHAGSAKPHRDSGQ